MAKKKKKKPNKHLLQVKILSDDLRFSQSNHKVEGYIILNTKSGKIWTPSIFRFADRAQEYIESFYGRRLDEQLRNMHPVTKAYLVYDRAKAQAQMSDRIDFSDKYDKPTSDLEEELMIELEEWKEEGYTKFRTKTVEVSPDSFKVPSHGYFVSAIFQKADKLKEISVFVPVDNYEQLKQYEEIFERVVKKYE